MILLHYLKVAIRNLQKRWEHVLITALGLAVGLVLFAWAAYLWHDDFMRYRTYPTFDRLVYPTVYEPGGELDNNYQSYLRDDVMKGVIAQLPQVEEIMFGYGKDPINVDVNGKELVLKAFFTSSNFNNLMPVEFVDGSIVDFQSNSDAILITESCAEKLFGGERAVGKSLYVANMRGSTKVDKYFSVAGVVYDKHLPNTYGMPQSYDIIFGDGLEGSIFKAYAVTSILLLKSADMLETVNDILANTAFDGVNESVRLRLIPIKYLTSAGISPIMVTIYCAFSLVFLISLIYALSYFIGNFMLRSKELQLRKVLGAGRESNVMLCFVEMFIYLLFVALLSIVMCELLFSIDLVEEFMLVDGLNIRVDDIVRMLVTFVPMLLILFFVVACVASAVTKLRSPKHRVKSVMLAFHFTITLAFLLLSGYMYMDIRNTKKGYYPYISDKELSSIWCYAHDRNYLTLAQYEKMIHDIEASPKYETAYAYSAPIFNESLGAYSLARHYVSVSYLKMMKIPGAENLNDGDDFCFISHNLQNSIDSLGYLDVSEFRGVSPGTLTDAPVNSEFFEKRHRVTGLVDNRDAFTGNIVLLPLGEVDKNICIYYIKVKDGYNVDDEFYYLESDYNKKLPGVQGRNVTAYNLIVSDSNIVLFSMALICFVVMLMISVSGIVSTISVDVNRREKEVAIRKINGAGFKQVYWLFGRLYCRIYVIAVVVVLIAWFFVTNTMLAGEELSRNPLLWLGVVLLAAVVILISIVPQIYRVARINPSEMLRSE